MKFRFHFGGFLESQASTVVLKPRLSELEALLEERLMYDKGALKGRVSVKPYFEQLDTRNGWKETNLVLIDGGPVGYTNEKVS